MSVSLVRNHAEVVVTFFKITVTFFKITTDQGSSFLIITPHDRGSLGTMFWSSLFSYTRSEGRNLPSDIKGNEKLRL